MVRLFLLISYSIFVPLKLSTVWFYAGLTIWLIGLGGLKKQISTHPAALLMQIPRCDEAQAVFGECASCAVKGIDLVEIVDL